MSPTPLLLRIAALVLAVMPMTADSVSRRHTSESGASPVRRVDRVRMTEDPASVAGCSALREIDLSGAVGNGNDVRSEDERDAILQSIAAHEGANTIFVLQRNPHFVRSQAFRCPEDGGLRQ
jgi:hypothetical protein